MGTNDDERQDCMDKVPCREKSHMVLATYHIELTNDVEVHISRYK